MVDCTFTDAVAQQGRQLLVARAADVKLMNRQLSEYPEVSIEAGTVEKELATFDFQSLEAYFEEIIELVSQPKAIRESVLIIGTNVIGDDSRLSVRVSAMPYEPQPGMMSCLGFVSARSISDGLELRIRIRRGGSLTVAGCLWNRDWVNFKRIKVPADICK